MPPERRSDPGVGRIVPVSRRDPALRRGVIARRPRAARRGCLVALLLLSAAQQVGGQVPLAAAPSPRSPVATATTNATVRWNEVLRQPAAWYATPEARAVADSVLHYQTVSGGWPKNLDMTTPPTAEFLADPRPDHRAAPLDNAATPPQVWLLARVATALGDAGAPYRAAALRGLDYLLAAQYPGGGWPQYFPLRPGYYTHITYNDDAMANVLAVLRALAAGRAPFAFVDAARRARAADAVQRGLACILRTQVRQDGRAPSAPARRSRTTRPRSPPRGPATSSRPRSRDSNPSASCAF